MKASSSGWLSLMDGGRGPAVQPLESLGEERARWGGRLAAVFFVASGVLGLLTLPLLPSDADLFASAAVALLAAVAGLVSWWIPVGASAGPRDPVAPRARLRADRRQQRLRGLELLRLRRLLLRGVRVARRESTRRGRASPPSRSPRSPTSCRSSACRQTTGPPAWPRQSSRCRSADSIGEALSRSIDRAVATETELRRERADTERLRLIDRMRETFMRAASHELRDADHDLQGSPGGHGTDRRPRGGRGHARPGDRGARAHAPARRRHHRAVAPGATPAGSVVAPRTWATWSARWRSRPSRWWVTRSTSVSTTPGAPTSTGSGSSRRSWG